MNQIREIQRINEEELSRGIAGTSASWHAKYAHSAWCFVGNLDLNLSEGDVIAVLSEYGEIDDVHLVREEDTGKSKGFAFCKYEDARSCVLAVDNLCGVPLLGRSLRVDHVENYRLPKNLQDKEEELQQRLLEKKGLEGHAYEGVELANEFSLHQGQDLFAKPPANSKQHKSKHELLDEDNDEKRQERQRKKEEKRKAKEEKRREKEKRKRERAEKRMKREEKNREKRAKRMRDGGHSDDEERERKSSKKHKKASKSDKKKRKRSERSRSRSSSLSPHRDSKKEPNS